MPSAYKSREHFQEVREIKEGKNLWFNVYTDCNITDMSGF